MMRIRKPNKLIRFAILLIATIIPLSSCQKTPEKEYTPEEIVEAIDDALHSVDAEIEEIPADEMDWGEEVEMKEVDDVEEMSSIVYLDPIKLHQVENAIRIADSRFLDLPVPYTNPSDYLPGPEHLCLYDENKKEYPLTLVSSTSGNGVVSLPIEDMWRGHLYHLDILDENICFSSKNPSIRSLSLIFEEYAPKNALTDEEEENPEEWPTDGLDRLDIEIKNFSPTSVYYYDQDSISLYFISAVPFTGLANNELFRVGEDNKVNGEWVDDEETFYGRFLSYQKNPNGTGYLVRYSEASAYDIYESTYSTGSKTIDMSDGTVVADHEQLEEMVLTSEALRKATYGIFNHYKVPPTKYRANALDWFSHLKVTFSTKYDGGKFVFKVTAKLTINPQQNLNIVLKAEFTSTTQYDVSVAAKIQKKWGFLPVGAQFNIKIEEDNVKTFNFGVMFDTSVNAFDKEKATDSITKAIDEANDETLPWKSIFSKNGEGAKTLTKDGAKWALFTIDINYFAPITIRLALYFYFEANLSFQAVLQYSSHTHRVDISYSTENKNDHAIDAANESKEVETGAISILFIGKMSVECGLMVTFGFGFFGLYKYLHAEVIVKAGIKLELIGYISFNWVWGEQDDGDFYFVIGGKLELSLVLSVSIDVFLIAIGYNHTWPLGSLVLVGLANMDSLLNWANEYEPYVDENNIGDEVNIRNGTKLNDLGLLIFTVFSGDVFAVKTVGYKYDYKVKVFYGALIPQSWEYSVDAFTITLEGNYLTLENGEFSATNDAPTETFDTIMTISVADSVGQAKTKKYRLRYHYSENELVTVTYTYKVGPTKEEAEPFTITTLCHKSSEYTFTAPKNSPLGMRITSYELKVYCYNAYDDEEFVTARHVYALSPGQRETIQIDDTQYVTKYEINIYYADAIIYPIYWLGFMGKVIYFKEVNEGETLNLTNEESAELAALASDTNTNIDSTTPSNSGNYVLVGWTNWPDAAINRPYVIMAKYQKVS